jgi:hypothetical protein
MFDVFEFRNAHICEHWTDVSRCLTEEDAIDLCKNQLQVAGVGQLFIDSVVSNTTVIFVSFSRPITYDAYGHASISPYPYFVILEYKG